MDIQTAWQQDPYSIILKLYDKTLSHVGRARGCLSGWDDENYQLHIVNAINAIEVLQMTLNRKAQNVTAENLHDMYSYVTSVLVDSIYARRDDALKLVVSLMLQIREALAVFVKKTPVLLQH